MTVALGLGSNRSLGDLSCIQILRKAIEGLGDFSRIIAVSSVYRTAAMYVTDQDDFYNMVIIIDYDGTPYSLLDKIHFLEASLGRDRAKEIRNGPRSLDIDIELFGREKISEPDLIIPHERMTERAFVLKPLLELMFKNAEHYNREFPETVDYYAGFLKDVESQEIKLLEEGI